MTIHELKIKTDYFLKILEGKKTFEIRKDDRGFMEGDIIHFRILATTLLGADYIMETDPHLFKITYVLRNVPEYGLKEGYAILGIKEVNLNDN